MSHAVHFRSSDGSTTFEEAGSLEDALSRVEQLRNEDGVSEVRVYREVPVAFRTYYKATVVEEPGSGPAPAPDPEPALGSSAEPAPSAPAAATDVPAPSSPPPGAMPLTPPASGGQQGPTDDAPAGGRGSLFSRG